MAPDPARARLRRSGDVRQTAAPAGELNGGGARTERREALGTGDARAGWRRGRARAGQIWAPRVGGEVGAGEVRWRLLIGG